MKSLKNLLVLLTVVVFFASCNKEKAIVSGTVSDAAGSGIEGVAVTVLNTDGTENTSTTTASDGTYELETVENLTIQFVKEGYLAKEETIGDKRKETVDVTLEDAAFNTAYFDNGGNSVTDPSFGTNSIVPTNTTFGNVTQLNDAFITDETFKGAVDPNATAPWYDGWSFYSNLVAGTTTDARTGGANTVTVTDDSMSAPNDTIEWVNTNTYVLDGFVYVEDGEVLKIQEGTVIQGKSGTGDNASALIVARGGKIYAEGTRNNPIIFTHEGDNGSDATLRGQWGGLIVLGKANLNSANNETAIEGIPTGETRGLYGGTDDTDNSGIIRYVSIRHGGSNIGSDNEINGLTLGGVGSGTTIDYVEVVGNKDDGIEWFGGAVNAKHLIVAFCADDALDYDEGYIGKNQYVIVHQASDDADRGGEHDGGTDPEDGTPFATPTFVNCTFVGNSGSRTITFRDNAGGYYYNSIFTGFDRGIDIEDLIGQSQDSYKQYQDGNLKIENNWFHNIGAGTTGSDLFKVSN